MSHSSVKVLDTFLLHTRQVAPLNTKFMTFKILVYGQFGFQDKRNGCNLDGELFS